LRRGRCGMAWVLYDRHVTVRSLYWFKHAAKSAGLRADADNISPFD
jgi:hypothetical protein